MTKLHITHRKFLTSVIRRLEAIEDLSEVARELQINPESLKRFCSGDMTALAVSEFFDLLYWLQIEAVFICASQTPVVPSLGLENRSVKPLQYRQQTAN